MINILCVLFFLLFYTFTASAEASSITDLDRTFYISSETVGVNLNIKSVEGEVLYNLRCNQSGYENDPDGFEYYGAFQCILLDVRRDSGDLFEEDYSWSKSWRTRGVFTYEQMVGPCKESVSYGVVRSMNIRDLNIEISLKNITTPEMADMINEVKPPSFSADLRVKVSKSKKYISGGIEPTVDQYCSGAYVVDDSGKLIYRPEHY